MSAPTAIEASLRLDIAQMKAALAESRGEATKWREKLREEGRKAAQAVDPLVKAHAEAAARMAATRTANPWATASAGALEYKRVLDSMTPAMARAHTALTTRGAATAAMLAPQAAQVNPWTTAGTGWKPAERLPQMAFGSEFDNTRVMRQQALEQRQAAALAAGRGGRGGSGAGMRGMGQAAMQAQDIAVQLQMGTRASIVLAQQGSQLLGAFGPAGAIVGGVVAIGGAFYTMKERSIEAFDAAKEKAAEFDQAMIDAKNGGLAGMVSGLQQITVRSREMREEMKSAVGWGAAFTEMVGGTSMADKIEFAAQQQRQLIQQRRELGQQMAEASADETRIAQLRSEGHEEEANALEREINLKRRLYEISRLDVDGWVKAQLSADARTQSAASALMPRDAKADKEEILRLDQKIEEARIRSLAPVERLVALEREEQRLLATMATTGGLFYEQSVAGLDAWADAKRKMGDTAGLIDVLKLREQVGAVQDQMKQANEAAQQEMDKVDVKMERKREAEERVKLAREIFEIEAKIAREQAAAGMQENAKVRAFQDALNVLQLTAQIREQLNVKEAEAARLAKERVASERGVEEAVKAREQLTARQNLSGQMRVDALRAAGRDKEADKKEREMRLNAEARAIHEQTGLGEQESARLARQHLEDQERADERRQGGPRKIRGVSNRDLDHDRYGLSGRASGHLYESRTLARHAPLTENGGLEGYQKLQRGEIGNLGGMIGPSGMIVSQAAAPMKGMHEANAARHEGGGAQTAAMEAILTKVADILTRGFWG